MYSQRFFNRIEQGSLLSARLVMPTVLQLVNPRSVVDVGCGTGAWLQAFQENGITDFLGVDGTYVDPRALMIPREKFQAADLTQPLALSRTFDLVVSLEVGEHLPASAAKTFVQSLVSLGDTVLFSAAIPSQGGTHHVNEQWPDYWKTLFEAHGFRLVDCLRRRFWENRDIETWYRQNLLLYVKEDRLRRSPLLSEELEKSRHQILPLVHPAAFLAPSLSSILQMIPRTLLRSLRRRVGRSG